MRPIFAQLLLRSFTCDWMLDPMPHYHPTPPHPPPPIPLTIVNPTWLEPPGVTQGRRRLLPPLRRTTCTQSWALSSIPASSNLLFSCQCFKSCNELGCCHLWRVCLSPPYLFGGSKVSKSNHRGRASKQFSKLEVTVSHSFLSTNPGWGGIWWMNNFFLQQALVPYFWKYLDIIILV